MVVKLVVLIWALFLWDGCYGRDVVLERKSLQVISPESLKDVHDSLVGNFPQHREPILGNVIYPQANRKGCEEFIDADISSDSKSTGLPFFLLLNRGDCFFMLKAWNAQKAGAAAVLIADDRVEPLVSMYPVSPGKDVDFPRNISIPLALLTRNFADAVKKALLNDDMVNIRFNLRESLSHPDELIKYEIWLSSYMKRGPDCNSQWEFIKNFKEVAQKLEQKGYTQFTPHYMIWDCPEPFVLSKQCQSQCVNHGMYCAPDPQEYFSRGYGGRDVVVQNLLQACLYKVANEYDKPWLWWDYVVEFSSRCTMQTRQYNMRCANELIQSLGLDLELINKCMGDPKNDMENPVLQAEKDAKLSKGCGEKVTKIPTLIINNKRFKGKLVRDNVLEFICLGFQDANRRDACLRDGREANDSFEFYAGSTESSVMKDN